MHNWDDFATQVASCAVRALLLELAATPKPGLVDRSNNGAHPDMEYQTFQDSAVCLWPYFYDITLSGLGHNGPVSSLLDSARPVGIKAEADMYLVTAGVNTHKGAIFSLGLCCLAAGVLRRRKHPLNPEQLLALCGEIAAGVEEDFSALNEGKAVSHGEEQFLRLGVKGARGEAANGFPAVGETGFPVLSALLKSGVSANDAGVATLLHLMAKVEDTNLIRRGGKAAQEQIREELAAFVTSEPPMERLLAHATQLDRRFIQQNLSPGGCADLLALSWLIWLLCGEPPL